MQRHDGRYVLASQLHQHRWRQMVIDVVRVRDGRPCRRYDAANSPSRIGGIDCGDRAGDLPERRTFERTVRGVGEIFRPWAGYIFGVLHRKWDDLPAGALEQSVVIEKNRLCPSATIVIVIDGEKFRHLT